MNFDLFADEAPRRWTETLAPGTVILCGSGIRGVPACIEHYRLS
ncbi:MULTISPECIES: hypothetical protein [Pectobacterium]|nr:MULTISPECIES: hypothetical protein [Pectobacterium]